MKVLVTGGAGFVGSWLVPELLKRGHHVHTIDNLMFRQTSLLPYFLNKNFSFTHGDVRNRDLMKKLVAEADCIVHLAAIVGEPVCRVNPDLATSVNLEASRLINELRGEKPLIYSSTGSNYGKVDGICTEETVTNPLSHYAFTKLEAENMFFKAGNAVIYRFATGFGVSPRMRLDLLINDFCHKAVESGHVIIYQRGARRTFIHVRDMARALAFAVENFGRMKNNIFNVGHESLNVNKEGVINIIRKYKPDFYVHFADIGTDPDQRDYEVSYAKIRAADFNTAITMEEGIEELLRALPSIKIYNPHSNFQF